jgi:hypothetical protein
MSKRVGRLAALAALVIAGGVYAQGMIPDMVANKVIRKYQSSSCEQLWERKGQPKSQEEERAVNFLRSDTQARIAFIDKVAGPIANKMVECGMIP